MRRLSVGTQSERWVSRTTTDNSVENSEMVEIVVSIGVWISRGPGYRSALLRGRLDPAGLTPWQHLLDRSAS